MTKALSFLAALMVATPAISQVVFDDFSIDQSGTSTLDTMTVIGGERDIETVNPGNSVAVSGGAFTCSGPNAFSGCTLEFDGDDNDAVNFTVPGFAVAEDLTDGGSEVRVTVDIGIASGGCNFALQLCDSSSNCHTEAVTDIAAGTHDFMLSDFTGVTVSQTSAIQFVLTLRSSGSNCSISGTPGSTPVNLLQFEVD